MSLRLTVIGAGTMGAGIAQVAAIHGFSTTLCDLSADQLSTAMSSISSSVEKGIDRGKTPPAARDLVAQGLSTETDLLKA